MSLVATAAIVLHAFDYLETSRVLRLLTREIGLQSVIAKGARRTRGRVGSGVDLFVEGDAELYVRPTRDLQTLGAFYVTRSRTALAVEMGRFMAASAIAELALRIAGADANPALYDAVADSLDGIAAADRPEVMTHALGGAWRIVAAAGFAPTTDECASCHARLPTADPVAFSHPAGGALCSGCGRSASTGRLLPPEARNVLRDWLQAVRIPTITPLEARAHQRLLREFLREHLSDDRPLRAFAAWETDFQITLAPVQ
jgi:DNA repair protein RecO (recombination protein O)